MQYEVMQFMLQGIKELMLSLDCEDYKAEILTDDTQASYMNGVIVLVTGRLSGRDYVRRNFTESFFDVDKSAPTAPVIPIEGSNVFSSRLDWEAWLKVALDATKGLEYLHKPLSLDLRKAGGHVSTRVLGNQGNVAHDYGVVLLELLTGRVPVDIKRPQGEGVLVSWLAPMCDCLVSFYYEDKEADVFFYYEVLVSFSHGSSILLHSNN
ncbi:hypothetical protein SOVF_175390 isoform A [Spinacia oleracea]|nr:hypothetical protein SOVF_175390 isoform A [Spinacia oleracea]